MLTWTVRVWLAGGDVTRDAGWGERVAEHFAAGRYEKAGALVVGAADALAALDRAFSRAQNVYRPWNVRQPCRSASVGDVFELVEAESQVWGRWVCTRTGWERLEDLEREPRG